MTRWKEREKNAFHFYPFHSGDYIIKEEDFARFRLHFKINSSL